MAWLLPLLIAAGCSADDVPPEVVAQDALPPVPDPDADDADGVDPSPGAADVDDAALASCEVADVPGSRWPPIQAEQDAYKAVNDVLEERFPETHGKKDPHRRLRDGFIGVAVDRPGREYIVVVDSDVVGVPELDAALKAAADAEHQRRPAVHKVKIRAQGGCHPSAKLIEALEKVPALIRPHRGQIGYHVSAYDSRIHVFNLDPNGPAAARLREQLGDLVSFED